MKGRISIATILLLLLPVMASAQKTISVKGQVTDNNGEPVMGAGVVISGTTTGTVTDLDGYYMIASVPEDASLEFSSIGFVSQTIGVAGRNTIDVSLSEDNLVLEDALVVAYGTAKKESFTGSASVVKGTDLQKRVVGNVTKSLEGTVAGVQVSSGGGQPGEGSSILIRGVGSVNASATPLYVVDGVPYDGSLSAINPSDIESMTILKDASAGALYGARGANGVVVITTKKGKSESSRVVYKGSVGVASRALKRYDLVDMDEYVELTYEALRNAAQYGTGMDREGASAYAAANLGSTIGGLKNNEYYNPYKNYTWDKVIDPETGKVKADARAAWNENWMDEISRKAAIRTEHSLSVSGNAAKSNYLISATYYDEKGVLQNTDFKRYTARVNVDTQATNWLKTGLSANYSHADSDFQGFSGTSTSNVWYTAQFMAPVYPVYLKNMAGNDVLGPDGERQYEYGAEGDNGYANRPSAQGFNSKAELFNNKSYYKRNTLSSRAYLTLGTVNEDSALYGLRFSVNFGCDFNDYQGTTVYDKFHGNASGVGGRLSKTNTRTLSYTVNQLVTYDRKFGDHDIKLLAGHEFYNYTYNYASGQKTGIVAGIDELAPAVTTADNTTYSHRYSIESVLARVNYGYKDRYYFDASWRTDGSSRFYKTNRWGAFWSVGASWRVSNENFMAATSSWLSNLTYKISYGVQGNDNLGTYYAWQGLYDYTWANGTEAGAFASSLENKNITWEKNHNLNTGFDASLFGGKLAIALEYYNRRTRDMLLSNPLALSTGFTGFNDNIGSMRNQGVEMSVKYVVLDKENFHWDASVMASTNHNKVIALTSTQDVISSGISVIEVGRPIYTFYMSKSAGVDSATGRQLYYAYYKQGVSPEGTLGNVKCDEYVTDNVAMASLSKYYMGSREPVLYGSIGSNFVFFKNLDLSFLTTYSLGGKVYDSLYSGTMMVSSAGYNWHKNTLRRWRNPGDVTDVPMVEIGGSYASSDNALVNASYFAIKNVTIGYTFPKKLLSKANIAALRLFASLDNIALFSHLDGMDPQYNFTGSVSYSYAPSRVAAFGLELSF